jgi:hypothetical protein
VSYLWILSAIIQVVFVAHVVVRKNDIYWIFIILFFPLLGCLAYALLVWIPDMRGSRTARGASRTVLSFLDPKRDLRRRLQGLDVSDTVQNRVALAQELVRHGMVPDALSLYERSLTGIYVDDAYLLTGYAAALFAAGEFAKAKDVLEKMRAANPGVKSQEAHLLYARSLQALGETEKALKEYAAVCRYFSGLEANCRYALLLKQQGRQAEAQDLFEDILQVTRHTSHHSRRLNREWIAIAHRELGR